MLVFHHGLLLSYQQLQHSFNRKWRANYFLTRPKYVSIKRQKDKHTPHTHFHFKQASCSSTKLALKPSEGYRMNTEVKSFTSRYLQTFVKHSKNTKLAHRTPSTFISVLDSGLCWRYALLVGTASSNPKLPASFTTTSCNIKYVKRIVAKITAKQWKSSFRSFQPPELRVTNFLSLCPSYFQTRLWTL